MNKFTVQLRTVAKYSDKRIGHNELNPKNYIGTDNLLPNKLGKVDAQFTPLSGFSNKYCEGDILIGNIRPYLKKLWYATQEGGSSPDVLTISVNKKNDSKFVYYSLFREDFFTHMMKGKKGTKMPRGDKDQVMDFLIPRIDLRIQQKISAALTALDDKIVLNNQISSELESFAKTIYDYWFLQFNFPDRNGRPYKLAGGRMIYCDELKREIPEDWSATHLSSITPVSNTQVNPADYPNKEFKYYSIPTYDSTGSYGITKGTEINSSKFRVTHNDILVSKLNPWFKRVIYPSEEIDLICSTEFVLWHTSNKEMKNFLFMVANDPTFIGYCTKSASGTSNSHRRVNPEVMMRYSIAYDRDTAEKLGSVLHSTMLQLKKYMDENSQLATLRDWLLPLLMNEQVGVK
jgi:type I restriction enzyme S subunit